MTIPVYPAGEQPDAAPEPHVGAPPVPSDSPLADLRKRRQAALETLYLDLKVPRWDEDGGPAVYVRYAPIDPAAAIKAVQKRSKARPRPDDYQLLATIDVLLGACRGVYAVEGDPADGQVTRYSLRDGDPYGEWTRFDHDLANTLGIEHERAVDIVRGLYFTDGDILGAYAQLSEWSGLTAQTQADEAFLGN